jgi:hypothetical protein
MAPQLLRWACSDRPTDAARLTALVALLLTWCSVEILATASKCEDCTQIATLELLITFMLAAMYMFLAIGIAVSFVQPRSMEKTCTLRDLAARCPRKDYNEIVKDSSVQHCAICLCEMKPDDDVRIVRQCQHLFHASCIEPWFLDCPVRCMSCPLCRGPAV